MLVNFVVVLAVLLGCCGLVLDVGLLQLKQLEMQSAADAAAMGAMLDQERGDGSWQAAGMAEATQNGFSNGVAGVSVSVTHAPAGYYVNDLSAVQAKVSQVESPIFMGVLKQNGIAVSAQAIAQAPPCGYFLGGASNGFSLWTASNGLSGPCPIYAAYSFTNDGFASTHMTAIRIAGSAGASVMQGNYSPQPYFNYPASPDPLSWVGSPSFNSCSSGDSNLVITTTTTLNPGTYCGGLTITNATVTLNPGLYIIAGGATWNGATVSGSGVTLFFTSQNGSSNYGQLVVRSNSVLNLSAPTTGAGGAVPGIVIFGDRNWVRSSIEDFQMVNATFKGDGIWYTTNTGIYFWQVQATPIHYFGLVTDNMYAFGSNIHLASDYSSLPGGTPFHPRGTLVQ